MVNVIKIEVDERAHVLTADAGAKIAQCEAVVHLAQLEGQARRIQVIDLGDATGAALERVIANSQAHACRGTT